MKLKKIAAAVLAAAVLATTPAAGALLSPFSVTANADEAIPSEGDYTYTVNEDGETVTIIHYHSGADTEVVIPRTLGGKNVTSIGEHAFYGCESLTNVTIPDSVTTIGDYAFSNCTSLASVTIPNSVTTIGMVAFNGCTSLTSVTIPDSVTTIGEDAFSFCTSLTSVTIPDSVTTIGDCAFRGCTTLASVTIPDSVTTIGDLAFYNCTTLASVIIPNSVTTIGKNAFSNCTSLENIIVGENNAYYLSINGVLFNKDKSKLIYYPAGMKNISYTIPDGVTTIGDYAFYNCTSLASVTIPDSVTTIENDAFSRCTSLTSVTIPDNVTTIGDYAFDRCTTLTSVIIPDGITTIGFCAFESCTSLETVYYGGTQAEWDAIEKGGGNKCLTDAEIICTDGIINEREPDTSEPTSSDTSEPTSSEPENLQPRDYFVDGNLEYTVLKDGTLEIRGFAGDETKEIVIPETVKGKKVTNIDDAAFMDCTSLTSVTIPDSVTKIGGYAFSGCTSLETVNYGGRKSDWEAIEIDIENEPLTNAEIKFAEQTVEIVDENTGVKTEVSTEDENLDGAEFEANPADHPTLWDLIKKIIEKAVDTIESVTEEAQKSLEEAAEAVKNGKGFAYDMGFKKNGKEVQPDKSVTVTVPVPDKFKNDIDKLNVYHLTNRGAVYVPSWIKDSSIMFRTNSFSPYVITIDKLEYAVADENTTVTPGDTDTANSGGSESGSDQKSTGIALAIAPVVLAVGMAIVALSKKKK